MAKQFSRFWSGRWLFFLVPLLAVLLAVLSTRFWSSPDHQPEQPTRLQLQSVPWHVGQDVELTLQSDLHVAGHAISLTILAPGSDQPQIEGLSPDFFGISGVQIPWLAPKYRETEVALAAAAGARSISLDFAWSALEPARGQYDWATTDGVVALAKKYHLQLVPMLLYTPRWASIAPFAPLNYQHAPPTDYADYRDFVYEAVSRYKPYGSSPLTADGYGITDWIIWNEPNVRSAGQPPEPGTFWVGSLEEYISLLRAGYEGAHAADPGCNVLNGALADLFWIQDEPYLPGALERFYDPNGDGDTADGARPFFDTLNLHTYQLGQPDAAWYRDRIEKVLEVMQRFGDAQKPVWITETGYGSLAAPVAGSAFVDEKAQADAVPLVYRVVSDYPRVERVFWWSLREYYYKPSPTNTEMEGHYGLLRADFSLKPAYLAYGRLTGHFGQVLSLDALIDETGTAQVSVPGSFVTQPGRYVVFATMVDSPPTIVAVYQAAAKDG